MGDREACQACHKMAKSNPSLPPYDPPEPEYPFQYLAADYFHYGNKDYCVVVDQAEGLHQTPQEDVLHCWNLPGNCYRRGECVHRRCDTDISEELGCRAPSVFC